MALKRCFTVYFRLALTRSLIKLHSASRLAMHLMLPLAPIGSLELLLHDSTGSRQSDLSALNVIDKRFIQSPSEPLLFFI